MKTIFKDHTISTKKGFMTIATGEKYRKIAFNLLCSYRRFSKNALPFAIVTDGQDKWTEAFDIVIIIDDPLYNFMDKLKISDTAPFAQTIFIDSDCLAYRDLNDYFDWFEENDSDFSVVGDIHGIEWEGGYFRIEAIKDLVSVLPNYIPSFNGGVYYIKKGALAEKVFDEAKAFAEHYDDFGFCMLSGDEPVLALSMAINNCKPVLNHHEVLAFIQDNKRYKSNPYQGGLSFEDIYGFSTDYGYMIHWGNYNTRTAQYMFDAYVIRKSIDKKSFKTKVIKMYFNALGMYYKIKRKLTGLIRRTVCK